MVFTLHTLVCAIKQFTCHHISNYCLNLQLAGPVQGLRTMVYFREIPATDLDNVVKELPALKRPGPEEDRRTIFVYDVKSYNDRLALKNSPRHWRSLPPLDEQHFQKCMGATFQTSMETAAFRNNDVLLVLDGRRSGASDRISRILGKVLKKQDAGPAGFPKRPCANPLRLLYHNAEFLIKIY